MEYTKQLSINDLSRIIASGNIAKIERETQVSRHNLLRVRAGDRTIPLIVIEKLNEYYGGE